jgi:hypothetical protein
MRNLMIGLGCLVLVACGTETSDVSDLDAQLTNDGVYGTFVTGDVAIDFASFPDGAGGYDVSIEPLILDPELIPVPEAASGRITILDENPGEDRQPPPDPHQNDAIDDLVFAIDTQLPGDHPAVQALRTAAEQL